MTGKYQDVLTLEQSVAELHQMFLDFALLTEQQGELLDQIEFQLEGANDHVELANVETSKALEYQSAVRKKQWYVHTTYVIQHRTYKRDNIIGIETHPLTYSLIRSFSSYFSTIMAIVSLCVLVLAFILFK